MGEIPNPHKIPENVRLANEQHREALKAKGDAKPWTDSYNRTDPNKPLKLPNPVSDAIRRDIEASGQNPRIDVDPSKKVVKSLNVYDGIGKGFTMSSKHTYERAKDTAPSHEVIARFRRMRQYKASRGDIFNAVPNDSAKTVSEGGVVNLPVPVENKPALAPINKPAETVLVEFPRREAA